jgi:hypothetical protein
MFQLTDGSTEIDFRMAKADVCSQKGAVIQFLVADCERPDCVEERLLRACCEATVVEITVPRWVTRTIETNIGTELRDRPRSDRT